MTWNWNFSSYEQSFIGTQPHPFIYTLPMAAFLKHLFQLSWGTIDKTVRYLKYTVYLICVYLMKGSRIPSINTQSTAIFTTTTAKLSSSKDVWLTKQKIFIFWPLTEELAEPWFSSFLTWFLTFLYPSLPTDKLSQTEELKGKPKRHSFESANSTKYWLWKKTFRQTHDPHLFNF